MPSIDRDQRLQTVSLLVLASIAAGGALVWLGSMLIPFVLAFFLSVVLAPVVNFLALRLRLPRPLAFLLSSLLGLGMLALFGTLVARSVAQLSANQDVYIENVDGLVQRLKTSGVLEMLRVDEALAGERFQVAAQEAARTLVGSLGTVLLNLTSQGLLVLIFVMFFMAGSAKHASVESTLGDVEGRIKGYVRTKLVVSGITGFSVWLVLSVLGVEMALVFGLFAFLLNFIPNIGSLIATLLPLPIVLLGDYGPATQVLAIALPGVIQFAVGNLIEPKMLGDSMDLHPVTILLALIFWGMVWGLVGALLATPLTAIVRILLNKEPMTWPVAEAMAGRFGRAGAGAQES